VLCVLSVCKKSFEFLVSINDEPLIDIDHVNEHLYEHVAVMHEAMVHLHFLVFRCRLFHCNAVNRYSLIYLVMFVFACLEMLSVHC